MKNVLCASIVLVAIPASAGYGQANFITLASHGYSQSTGWQADSVSRDVSISADGRFVAFTSRASNLVPGDTNNRDDVFVLDRETEEITRVSVSSAGIQSWGGHSSYPSISADGRYVAFESTATEFHPRDRNSSVDIFVHDRVLATTTRVSVSSSGEEANRGSEQASISGNGRYVAFHSNSTNLVPGDNNGHLDVFVRDLKNGTTIRVPELPGDAEANGSSTDATISFEGRYVAFYSYARNLVPNDNNGWPDVFVTDLVTGKTTCASLSMSGTVGNGHSLFPRISGNGRFVSFTSESTDLVPNDTNDTWDVFLRDLWLGVTTRESVDSNGLQGNEHSTLSTVSHDGRVIAFRSGADNFAPLGQYFWADQLFVRDRLLGTTTLFTKGIDGQVGNHYSYEPVVSGNGTTIVFSSTATNLVLGDTNGSEDVFIYERPRR